MVWPFVEKKKEETNDLLSNMKYVFEYMDEAKIAWLLKNLHQLNLGDMCALMAHAQYHISSTPSFAIQAKWYGLLMCTRNPCVQSALVGAMLERGGQIVNRTKVLQEDKFLIETDYIVNNYSVSFSYYADCVNPNMPAELLFWTFFSHGIFDDVLTPAFVWKRLVSEYGLDKMREGMEQGKNLKKHFKVIINGAKKHLLRAELDELIAMLNVNATVYGWETDLAIETKSIYSNVVQLH